MFLKKLTFVFAVLLSSVALWNCNGGDDDPNAKGPSCNISNADLSYTKNIKRIIDAKCVSCHGGNGPGPDDYRTYQGMVSHIKEGHFIEKVVIDKTMPESGITMTQAQRDSINCWLKAGYPQ